MSLRCRWLSNAKSIADSDCDKPISTHNPDSSDTSRCHNRAATAYGGASTRGQRTSQLLIVVRLILSFFRCFEDRQSTAVPKPRVRCSTIGRPRTMRRIMSSTLRGPKISAYCPRILVALCSSTSKFAAAVVILQAALYFGFAHQEVVGVSGPPSPTSSERSIASLTGGFLEGRQDIPRAEKVPCSAEGMLELSGMFNSGHRISVCMPEASSEEYVSVNIKSPTRVRHG